MAKPSALLHATAGSLGGAIAMLILYPLERVRIEFQTVSMTTRHKNPSMADDEWSLAGGNCSGSRDNENDDDVDEPTVDNNNKNTLTLLDCLKSLYNSNDLYRGLFNNVLILAVSNFVFFYGNQRLKNYSNNKLLNSCIAGIGNVLITNPLWVANTRIILSNNNNNARPSLLQELSRIAQTSSVLDWWSGTAASILLVSNPILQFYTYETVKARLLLRKTTTNGNNKLSASQAFVTGAFAKLVATICTYPLQLAQTLQRLETCGKEQSVLACLVAVYKRDRMAGLFAGMKAKLLQTVLTAAFTFLSYEQILGVLHKSCQTLV